MLCLSRVSLLLGGSFSLPSQVVTDVVFAAGAISYTTFDARSVDRLRVAPSFLRAESAQAAAPALAVTSGGRALPRISPADLRRRGAVGWAFDDASGVLDIAHNASDVRVLGGGRA